MQRNTPIARQVLDRMLADGSAGHRDAIRGSTNTKDRLHYDRLLAGIVSTEKRRNAKGVIVTVM